MVDKNTCFKVAKNVWVDKEGAENRKAYIFDDNKYAEIPIDFELRVCNRLFDRIKNMGYAIEYFSHDEMIDYYDRCNLDSSLSDLDCVAVLTSVPHKSLREIYGEDEVWFMPDGLTAEDFGEADYY